MYLEIFPIEEKIKWAHDHPDEPPIMIFVKHFDVSTQTLAGVGHFYVHKNMRVQDLVPMICEKTAVPMGTPLKIYEVNRIARGFSTLHSTDMFCVTQYLGDQA